MPISLVTWNMQGGSGADINKNSMLTRWMNDGVDVICLQEATNPLSSFNRIGDDGGVVLYKKHEPLGSYSIRNHNQYTCYYYEYGANTNSRCSLVTYVKNGSTTTGNFGIIGAPASATGNERRPLLWVRVPLPLTASILYIGNVHLISGFATVAKDHFNIFKIQMSMKGSYVIAGDFNMDFNSFIKKNFPDYNNFNNPGVATQQSGNTLDYVYSTRNIRTLEYGIGFTSDHRPLICTLE